MRRTAVVAVLLVTASSLVFADLELRVVDAAGGTGSVAVAPGAPIAYRLEAELDAGGGQGLALLSFDLALAGGEMQPLAMPAGSAMASFAPPPGYSPDPTGYGGLAIGGALIQAGGAQNVFNHGAWLCDADRDCPAGGICSGGLCSAVAGLPTAPPVLGVALAGSATDATGDPVWRTEPVATITSRPLEIVVEEGGQQPEAIPAAGPVGLAVLILVLALAGVLLVRRRR